VLILVLFGDLDDDPASRDTSVEVCINNQMPLRILRASGQGLLGPPLFWYRRRLSPKASCLPPRPVRQLSGEIIDILIKVLPVGLTRGLLQSSLRANFQAALANRATSTSALRHIRSQDFELGFLRCAALPVFIVAAEIADDQV
jgi:hypothetical protein